MTLFSDTAQLALQGDSALSRKPSKLELVQARIHQRNRERQSRSRRRRCRPRLPAAVTRQPAGPSPGDIQTLRFIAFFIAERGYPPTTREMADGLGYTSSHASADRIERCERKGFLVRSGVTHSRGLRLTVAGRRVIGVDESAAPAPPVVHVCAPVTGTVIQEWKCPTCGASTFDPARGCSPCLSGRS